MLAAGHDWVIETLEDNVPSDQIDDKERYWIAHFRKQGIKLTNLADGGEGGKGLTPDIIKKIVASRSWYSHSEETKARISRANKGRVFTKQHKAKLSRAWRKRTVTEETRRKCSNTSKGKINIKRYVVTSPDGQEHVTEQGLSQFCREHNLSTPLMVKVANGERQHHKGWACKRLDKDHR